MYKVDTLIIRAELSNPPSEALAFRSLTMLTKEISLDNLIEIEQDYKDIYYYYLKYHGLMDFVEQIVTPPEEEKGIRVDRLPTSPLTIRTDRIIFSNVLGLIGKIATLKEAFGSL